MNNQLHPCKQWDVITNARLNVNGGLVKPPLNVGMDEELHPIQGYVCNYFSMP